jgi:hypothetical protein
MALAQVDFADVIAGNSTFAGDRSHQVTDLYTIARSNGHEKARHPAGRGPGSIAISEPWLRGRGRVLGSSASLCALALEQVKRRGSELRSIELLEKRLQRDDLARRNTAIQHRPKLLSNSGLAIMRPALGAGEIERGEASTRQLSEPGNLSRSRQYNDLHRFCLSGSLELRGRNRRLEENHRVRRSSEIVLRHPKVRVVIVISEGTKSLLRGLGRRSISRHDYGGGRVEVVEQAPERGRSCTGADGNVPDNWKLVIFRHLWRFVLGGAYLPGSTGVALDQILDGRSNFANDDHPTRVAKLAEQRFECGDRFRSFLEDVVGPGEDDCLHGIDLEKRSADESTELCCATGNGEDRPDVEDPRGAGRIRDGNDLDSRRACKAQHRLGDGESRFRIASYDHDLRASRRGIDTRQDRSQKFRNRLGRMRKGVNEILVAARLSGRALSDFLRFQHPKPLFCNVA